MGCEREGREKEKERKRKPKRKPKHQSWTTNTRDQSSNRKFIAAIARESTGCDPLSRS
jgi:hypothetical protein